MEEKVSVLLRFYGRKLCFFAAFTKEINYILSNSSAKHNSATISLKKRKLRHTTGKRHRQMKVAKAQLLPCAIPLLQWEQHYKKHFSFQSTSASHF